MTDFEITSFSILLKPVFSLKSVYKKEFLKCSSLMITDELINKNNIDSFPLIIEGNKKRQWQWIFSLNGKNVFICNFSIQMKYFDYLWEYSILDFKESIFIQKRNEFKAKIYSCNGSEDGEHVSKLKKEYALQQVSDTIGSMQDHTFLISLGDTFYYDGIWEEIEELSRVEKYSNERKINYLPSQKLYNSVMVHMFYQSLTEMKKMQKMMSRSISIMVWDDHDFGINGYHSHPYSLRSCPLYQMIGYCASFHYFVFQLKLNPLIYIPQLSKIDFNTKSFGEDFFHLIKYNWNRVYQFEKALLIMLDLRAFRTRYSVMKYDAFFELNERLNRLMIQEKTNKNKLPKYCMIGSSVPLVFFNVSVIEKMFQKVIKSVSFSSKMMSLLPVCLKPTNWISTSLRNYLTSLSTDFVDQWSNDNHSKEKNQFFSWMYNWSRKWGNMKMIVLSGDVHIPYINHMIRVQNEPTNSNNKPIKPWSAEHIVTSALTNKPIPFIFSEVYNILAKMNNRLLENHLKGRNPEHHIDKKDLEYLNSDPNNIVQYIDSNDDSCILSSYGKWKKTDGNFEPNHFIHGNNFLSLKLNSMQNFMECYLHSFDALSVDQTHEVFYNEIYPNPI